MNQCTDQNCKLKPYTNKDKCILHYNKSLDGSHYANFSEERDAFYKALSDVIEVEKTEPSCHLVNIHFPRPDTQGKNYETLLSTLEEIHFDTCSFYGTKLVLIGKVFFQDCTFYNDWSTKNYKIRNDMDVSIYSHCKFNSDVKFNPTEYIDDKGKNKIDNIISNSQFDYGCTFKKDIEFENAIIHSNIFNDYQENHIGSNFTQNIIFNKCIFEKKQEFYLGHNEQTEISFSHCIFNSKLKIRNVELNEYEELSYEEQQNNKSKLKKISIINCETKEGAYLRFGFLDVDKFILSNLKLPENAELNIGDCFFRNFHLTNFRNIGKFKLYKINILKNEKGKDIKVFQIDNTSIGKTDFQSLNLSSFNKVIMFDNIFTEIDYTNIQWKKNIHVGQFRKSKDIKLAKKRDTYRVLKNIAKRNNDQSQALIFYNLEMHNHYNITKWAKEPTNKFILFINKITNNFGLNWWKPIVWIIGFSILFYFLLIYSTSGSEYFFANLNYKNYMIFLNPTHKVEFTECWSGWTYTIDLIFRIIEGMLIYQFIQASRKYSRML